MPTSKDLRQRARQQRQRRMARRICGACDSQAEAMLDWSGQRIPICRVCLDRLNGRTPYWSDWSVPGQQQGMRCPVNKSRPCYDCISGKDPSEGTDRRETDRPSIRSLFGRRH